MNEKEILDYIKENKDKYSRESLDIELEKAGVNKEIINSIWKKNEPKKKSKKIVISMVIFLVLVVIVTSVYFLINSNNSELKYENSSFEGRPFIGSADAKVTIVEYSDFECPFCARFYSQTYGQLKDTYIASGDVKLVFKDFPLSFHQLAEPAGIAGKCVFREEGNDAFFTFHDLVFENQQSLNVANLKVWALESGVSEAAYNSCIVDPEVAAQVQADFAEGQAFGISGTPSFVINGQLLVGAQPFEAFQQVILEEISNLELKESEDNSNLELKESEDNSNLELKESEDNSNLELKESEFIFAEEFGDEIWQSKLKIENKGNEIILVDVYAQAKEKSRSFSYIKYLSPKESATVEINIDHYFFDEKNFQKNNITIKLYDCSLIQNSAKDEFCVYQFGLRGIQVLKKEKELGNIILPTSTKNLYFDFNSLEIPPKYISKEEYLQ